MRTAIVCALALAGCLPDDLPITDGTPPADASARELFESEVHPILARSCIGCHRNGAPSGNVTGFVDPSAQASYDLVVGYRAVVGDFSEANAPVLTFVTRDHHKGLSYSTADVAAIVRWLSAEVDEREPTSEPQPVSKEQAMQEWSGCMSLENFRAANMEAWRNVPTTAGVCEKCHNLGEYGQITTIEQPFFDAITQERQYFLQYFNYSAEQQQIVINETTLAAVAQGLAPHEAHPRFELENEGTIALRAFYDLTKQRKAAGTCDPSRLH
ncbi:MAG TPA: hypothetical protein VFQ53_03035 [Kofleriaceae bacterium]|nr:hypothetical protein [Kofleriaceae bacterium]